MSIPVRAADGCVIATRLNSECKRPFWLREGDPIVTSFSRCPTETHSTKCVETPLYFFGILVGSIQARSTGSRWLETQRHSNVKYFIGHDVYCKSCDAWHFKGQKNFKG